MDDQNYFLTMVVTGFFLIVSIVYIAQTTDAFTPLNKSSPEIKIPEFEAIPEQTIDCNVCHKKPETLFKHILGGNYCSECHGTQLHDLHNKENGPDCKTCHGDDGKIPEKLPGHMIVCDSCHGYPDALSPSFGNLITIHVARGNPCDICHIQDIASMHEVES